MSTTTKEDKPSLLEDLKSQAAALAAKIKAATDAHLTTLHEKLKDAHQVVESLTAEIQKHSSTPAPAKRGRKPNALKITGGSTVGNGKKPAKKAKGKRGSVGEAITAFVTSKGKAGAHVKEIAEHLGSKPANVTAFFYAKGNRNKFKNLGKSTWVLKK